MKKEYITPKATITETDTQSIYASSTTTTNGLFNDDDGNGDDDNEIWGDTKTYNTLTAWEMW